MCVMCTSPIDLETLQSKALNKYSFPVVEVFQDLLEEGMVWAFSQHLPPPHQYDPSLRKARGEATLLLLV